VDTSTAIVIAPLGIALLTVVAVVVADMLSRRAAVLIGAVGLAVAAAFAAYAVYALTEVLPVGAVVVGGLGYSAPTAVICALGSAVLLGGWHWYVDSPRGGAAAALVVMLAAASAALSVTIDLLFLLIVLEIIAVCGYALVGQRGTAAAGEASVKFVIQGAVATGLLVLALAILFGLNGSITAVVLAGQAFSREYAVLAMLVVGLLAATYSFKLGAFPFHSWAPDAFETAPAPSGAALASLPKVGAILSAFLVFFFGFGSTFETVRADGFVAIAPVWAALATASIVFGNLVALPQKSYTRMLGYSGIAQVGYAMIGLAVVVGDSATEGVASNMPFVMPGAAILISAYAVAVVGAFLVAEAARRKRPDWDGSIAGLAGLGRESVALGLATSVIMLSLTGIPLTAGFWGKLAVFGAAAETGWVWLAVVGVLGSVVSFGYYGNVLKVMYLDDPPEHGRPSAGRGRAATIVTSFIALDLLVIGIFPLLTGITPLFRFFAF
jgi:NADH-quinone oxidoreductase subunit N